MLSSFTLISLIGVVLGVSALVVVMAVYAGLERSVKERVLGFSPHILLQYAPGGFGVMPMAGWEQVAADARELPHVLAAGPHVADNVVIDVEAWQRPVAFLGIDPRDTSRIDGIRAMLDTGNHPESSADLGIDDRVIVSSILADQFAIGVGDTVRLLSTRNLEEVMRAYKSTESPPMREAHAEAWNAAVAKLDAAWKPGGDGFAVGIDSLMAVYEAIDALRAESIREPEAELLVDLLIAMEAGEKDETEGVYRFTGEGKAAVDAAVGALQVTDVEKMDAEVLKGLRKIVLPKEAEVIGVYQASQMAATPDLFVPMPLAQSLAGLEGDQVQGVALRLDDPYRAGEVAGETAPKLGPDFRLQTWGDQYRAFFSLISQQRVMMYFVMSIIVLLSAFSMMAVMFTVTIQKRREIGVMKALGAAPGQIVRVFLYQGMLLGAGGGLVGWLLGRLVIHFRGPIQGLFRVFGFDPFAASLTGFSVLPAHNDPLEQFLIGVMAFVLCSVAALVPAFFAARSDAAKSLRNL